VTAQSPRRRRGQTAGSVVSNEFSERGKFSEPHSCWAAPKHDSDIEYNFAAKLKHNIVNEFFLPVLVNEFSKNKIQR
jgi:hypothetical protein